MKGDSAPLGRIVIRLACVLAPALIAGRPAFAQQAQSDTAAVGALLRGVLTQMGPEVAGRVRPTTSAPWRIELPRSAGWVGVPEGLARILQSRQPTPADSEERYLAIHQTAASDSERVFDVTIGQRWRCRAPSTQWIISESVRHIRIVLRKGYWLDDDTSPWAMADPGVCDLRGGP